MICLICKREIDGNSSKHHLVPVLKGGNRSGTVILHRICHDKIHSLFTEQQLAIQYNTIDKLLESEDVKKFVKWVENKPSSFYDGSKKNNKKPGYR